MIIVKSIKEKPEECRGCRFHDKEGDCYLLPESRCYETYSEQYEHCPIEEAPDINVGNINTTTHDSIPAETGENDGDGTSGDCISRQRSVDALCDYLVGKRCPDDGTLTCRLIENEVIDKLPSIQPERKTGRWIPDNTDYYHTKFICSACGKSEEVPTTGFGYGTTWDYCPMCGAKMEGGEVE